MEICQSYYISPPWSRTARGRQHERLFDALFHVADSAATKRTYVDAGGEMCLLFKVARRWLPPRFLS